MALSCDGRKIKGFPGPCGSYVCKSLAERKGEEKNFHYAPRTRLEEKKRYGLMAGDRVEDQPARQKKGGEGGVRILRPKDSKRGGRQGG